MELTWDWEYTRRVLPHLIDGIVVTIQATFLGFALALVVGLVLALARRSSFKVLSWPASAIVEFIRSTPLIAQLFFLFYVLPHYGLTLSPLVAGILGLGLHYGGYTSEIYRAGIEAVGAGQWQAATALNFSRRHTWTNIILPQAIPPMFPVFGNRLIAMFKETPQLAFITVVELFQRAYIFGTNSFRYLEPFTLVGVFFFAVSYPSALIVQRLEARYGQERR